MPPPPPPPPPPSASGGGIRGVRYSDAVEKALQEVCPSDDPLDQPDFDPIDYINKELPDEQSLSQLPRLLGEHQRSLASTEEQLAEAVRTQASSANSAARDLHSAREAVVNLHHRVSDIKSKAEESERTVTEICHSIRKLDTAKKNLGDSIRVLRNLQLFMMQLQNLKASYQMKDFEKMNDAIRSANMYNSKFDEFKDVAKVKELRTKFQAQSEEIEHHILTSVFLDMQRSRESNGSTGISEHDLRHACLVMDALGKGSRDKMRQKIIAQELEAYSTRFRRGTEEARLDRTEQRYAFIRRLLETNEHLFWEVLPKSWCVPHELCVEFCLATRTELTNQLKFEAGAIDVAILVYVVQKTIEIEKELTQRMRWRDEAEKKEFPEYRYYGMIVKCFDDHMGLYIQHENDTMEETIKKQLAAEDWQDANVAPRPGSTLSSCEDLFMFIKESLRRVAKLNQPNTLAKMIEVWKHHLINYTAQLSDLMPNPPVDAVQERRVSLIINTADQCLSTSQALADEVQAKLADAEDELQKNGNFDNVADAYSKLLSSGIQSLVTGVERVIAPAMNEFSSGQFLATKHDVDGSESPYVLLLVRVLNEHCVNIALILPNQLLRFFLEKFAATFIPKYTTTLYRLKRLNDLAVNQIRVDLKYMEQSLLALPNAGNPNRFEGNMLSRYIKLVKREFAHMAASLKVLQCEADLNTAEMYHTIVPEEHRSVADFVRLMEVKGVKREDMRPWIAVLKKLDVPETTKHDADRDALLPAAPPERTGFSLPFGGGGGNTAQSLNLPRQESLHPEGSEPMTKTFRERLEGISVASDFLNRLKKRTGPSN